MTTTTAATSYLMKNYSPAPVELVRGRGTRVWDAEGKEYLDFASGIAVTTLGHAHPAWVEAVRAQAGELVHVSNLFRNPLQERLAERLVARAGPGRVFFCNSGAEANEALLKLARLHGRQRSGEEGQRVRVLCAENGFHGRTFGAMSATPQAKVRTGYGPLLPDFAWGRFNDPTSFEALVDDRTAAVLVETIQGEGGIHPATTDFLRGLRELCDRHGLLLMLDEVQCGVGRTGNFFAYEASGVKPDAIGMAKGLGGGFPIGAIWAGGEAAELFTPGSHGTTFGGTPLACAAALAVLDTIEREDLLGAVKRFAPAWHGQLRELAADFPGLVKEVRARGFMIGLGLTVDPAPVVAALREAGLLVPAAGGNTIRLLPPLTATADELTAAVGRLRSVFASTSAA